MIRRLPERFPGVTLIAVGAQAAPPPSTVPTPNASAMASTFSCWPRSRRWSLGAGLVGALFRLLVQRADDLRDAVVAWAHGNQAVGFLYLVAACAAATATAAWLVRRFAPEASGSGIPHVEAVVERELPPAPIALLPVKFLGGLLAIGSGLALGRDGPSVQMGASIAHAVGSAF